MHQGRCSAFTPLFQQDDDFNSQQDPQDSPKHRDDHFHLYERMLRVICAWPGAGTGAALFAGNAYIVGVSMLVQLCIGANDLREFAYQAGFVVAVSGCLWNHLFVLVRGRQFGLLVKQTTPFRWSRLPPVDRVTSIVCAAYVATTLYWAAYSFLSGGGASVFNVYSPVETPPVLMTALQTAACLLYDVAAAAVNGLYLKLAVMICAQLRALKRDLETVPRSVAALRACVRHHQSILRLVTEMDNLLSPMFLGHFLIAIMGICFVQFAAVMYIQERNFGIDFLKMIVIWMYLTTQLIWFCWLGSKITSEAESVGHAVYCCDWTTSSLQFRRSVLQMTLVAPRRCELSAGGFVSISLATMSVILQQSFSYMMVMISLNHKQDISNSTKVLNL